MFYYIAAIIFGSILIGSGLVIYSAIQKVNESKAISRKTNQLLLEAINQSIYQDPVYADLFKKSNVIILKDKER
jgi:hypothetical protein